MIGAYAIAVIDKENPNVIVAAKKGSYPHFMLKEIFEQPKTRIDCMRGRVSMDEKNIS